MTEFCLQLGLNLEKVDRLSPCPEYKDWNDQLLDKKMEQEEATLEEDDEERRQGLHL